jgi:pimeloyl-ACP methyl ester carboxylesterase
VESQLARITAPTLVSCGRHDTLTSTRFAVPMVETLRNSELLIFEGCAHAPIYEDVQEFNEKTLQFLLRHPAAGNA